VVGIGGVIFDPADGYSGYFGLEVGSEIVDASASEGSQQLIGQAELLPVALARAVWRSRFCRRSAIVFIDNEAARCGLIRAYSPNRHSGRLIDQVTYLDISDLALCWYERVPSASNVADPPSRGQPPPGIPGWPAAVRVDVSADSVRLLALGPS